MNTFLRFIRVVLALSLASLSAVAVAQYTSLTLPSTGVSAVPTFESIGVYWTPGSNPGTAGCTLQYRKSSDTTWLNGLALWYDSNTSQCRGSLVQLSSGTSYDIQLGLPGQAPSRQLRISTWSETFPIAQTITLPAGTSNQALNITQSGSPSGYVLYTTNATTQSVIDVANAQPYNININASYVIIRGLVLKGAQINSINLVEGSHDIVIDKNDISGWGRPASVLMNNDPLVLTATPGYGRKTGYTVGQEMDSGVYMKCSGSTTALTTQNHLIVQRNTFHDPRYGSNSWTDGHPNGPQAVTLYNCGGNNVYRYNKIVASLTGNSYGHWYNDPLGGAQNLGKAGWPNFDSDVYGNWIEDAMDDCIEADGGNRNVRIWGNYCNNTGTGISITLNSVGPSYIFRNVYNRNRYYEAVAPDADEPQEYAKAGAQASTGLGRAYLFHNTTLQATALDADDYPAGTTFVRPLGTAQGIARTSNGNIQNVISRNNIWQGRMGSSNSVFYGADAASCDLDYDLFNGNSTVQESHGIYGVPIYAANNGWQSGAGGMYQLATNSPGYDQGVRIPNFNDNFTGAAPDMGAAEAGTPPMVFGPNGGNLTPTPSPTPAPAPTPAPTPTPTPSVTPSAAGTAIPPATQIVDAALNAWTLTGGVVYKNGTTAAYSANVIEVYWNGSTIYQENSAGNWYSWTGSDWVAATNPVPTSTTTKTVTTSAPGTSIPPATQIIDASKNVWTVAGGVVYQNGTTAAYSSNVVQLYWNGSTIYQKNSAGNWYSWNGSDWSTATNPVTTSSGSGTGTTGSTGGTYSGTPFTGTPIRVPGAFEAENFDRGGQNVAYYDTTPGNLGAQYRLGEDVDIINSCDAGGGSYAINNFATGEWMKYTINVASSGNYLPQLRISNATKGATPAFHLEVDGVKLPSVKVPNTKAWCSFVWVTAPKIALTAGMHVLTIVSDQQFFNLNNVQLYGTP